MNNITDLLLVRHAKKAHTGMNVGLGDEGRAQAQQTAEMVAVWKPEYAVSSPLLRATETAQILCEKAGISFDTNELLEERRVGGSVQTAKAIFVAEWAKTEADRDYLPVGGESSRMAGDRFEKTLIDIINQCGKRKILVVAHGGIMCDFLLNTKLIEKTDETNDERLPLSSVTEVKYDGVKWELIRIGETQ